MNRPGVSRHRRPRRWLHGPICPLRRRLPNQQRRARRLSCSRHRRPRRRRTNRPDLSRHLRPLCCPQKHRQSHPFRRQRRSPGRAHAWRFLPSRNVRRRLHLIPGPHCRRRLPPRVRMTLRGRPPPAHRRLLLPRVRATRRGRSPAHRRLHRRGPPCPHGPRQQSQKRRASRASSNTGSACSASSEVFCGTSSLLG